MSATAREQQTTDAEAKLDAEVEQMIAACEGDTRGAVRALIIFAHIQETKLADMRAAVSHGFARGRFSLPRESAIP
jgi:hypothetical protein